jgi:hypothetical protein
MCVCGWVYQLAFTRNEVALHLALRFQDAADVRHEDSRSTFSGPFHVTDPSGPGKATAE